MSLLDSKAMELMVSGLKYPEGPIHCKDGSIILVEIMGQQLSVVPPEGGSSKRLAAMPGGPNGAAAGPDGYVYVCNNGGFEWTPIPNAEKPILWIGGNQPHDYIGGNLQKVNPGTGDVTDLYKACTEREFPPGTAAAAWSPPFPLRGPDDLVIDAEGGIWFTDYGKQRIHDKDITAVYYATSDGKSIRQMIYPLNSPNGIGLSPCGKKLYVALTFERKILRYDIPEPGVIDPNKNTIDGSYLLAADFAGQSVLDSMALDAEGNVYVATMLPEGNNPLSNGGISIVSPDGKVDFVQLDLGDGLPAPLPSNICFGGKDMKTAYVTCGASGHLLKMPASIPGHELNFNGSHYDPNKVKK